MSSSIGSPQSSPTVNERSLQLALADAGVEWADGPTTAADDLGSMRVDLAHVDVVLTDWADGTDVGPLRRVDGTRSETEASSDVEESAAVSTPRADCAPGTRIEGRREADPEALYALLRELDREAARIQLRRADIIGELITRQSAADLAAEPEPSPARRERAALEARAAVVDSVVATTGGRRGDWEARARFAMAPESITRPLRDAVAAGTVSFEQAGAVVADTASLNLPSDRRAAIAGAVSEYAGRRAALTGAGLGQREFRAKLRREVIKHAGTAARRETAAQGREVWIRDEVDGSATIGMRGRDARCVGAYRRVDAIARALRSGGDARTLPQLRSDVALDLLLFGVPAPDAPTATDHPGDPDAGWPAAVVNVVVSAASLLGLNDEPGLVEDTAVAAATVRRVAHARGGVWRRIVTDEATGYAMNAVVRSYRPPEAMARVVRARDARCRAPGCTRPAAGCDLDHVHEWHDGGQTCGANLADLCRPHHSKKTRHHWAAAIADDGRIQWRLPDGRTYATFPMDYRELGRDAISRDHDGVVDARPRPHGERDHDTNDHDTNDADELDADDRLSDAEAVAVGSPDSRSREHPSHQGEGSHSEGAQGVGNQDEGEHGQREHDEGSNDPLSTWLRGREAELREEIARLRADLDAESAAHRACRRAFEDFRGDHPPF